MPFLPVAEATQFGAKQVPCKHKEKKVRNEERKTNFCTSRTFKVLTLFSNKRKQSKIYNEDIVLVQ